MRSFTFFYYYYYYFYKVLETRCIFYTYSSLSYRSSRFKYFVAAWNQGYWIGHESSLSFCHGDGHGLRWWLLHFGMQSDDMGTSAPCCPKRNLEYKWGFNLCCCKIKIPEDLLHHKINWPILPDSFFFSQDRIMPFILFITCFCI